MNKRDRELQKRYDKLNESMGIFKPVKKAKPKKKKHKKENKAFIQSENKYKGFTYDELLKTPEWAKKRIEILIRDNKECLICKSNKKLHVHHRLYKIPRLPWEYKNNCLATLCEKCHKSIHQSSINTRIMEYEISEKIGSPDTTYSKSRYI